MGNNKYNNPHGSNEQENAREQDPESLHQGQGPEFQTQDATASKRNPAVEDLKKQETVKKNHTASRREDYENVGEGDAAANPIRSSESDFDPETKL
ncbi:MAG TPA: hypothetical protein VD816_07460 [Ohtaekwangia sp.]|nr:hypothetical protein [Ohtaekwangia sp.]